jgi:hypothetical protein
MDTAAHIELTPVQIAIQKATASGTAKIKADLAKGTTKAKTATTPAGKQKFAAKIKAAQKTQSTMTSPGEFARCRAIAGGDVSAGLLLYRIAYLWTKITSKMTLSGTGQEYLAMTQADWGMSAGVEPSAIRNYAIPRLKKYAHEIVEIEVHGRGASKKTWVRFNPDAYRSALDTAGYELKISAENGAALYT